MPARRKRRQASRPELSSRGRELHAKLEEWTRGMTPEEQREFLHTFVARLRRLAQRQPEGQKHLPFLDELDRIIDRATNDKPLD